MRETYQPITISPAGPPYDHTPGATTLLSHRRRESTQCDRVQRTTTKTRARPRARTRGNGVPFPFSRPGFAPRSQQIGLSVIPAHTHVTPTPVYVIPTHPRHSHTHPTSFPHPVYVIPAKAGIHSTQADSTYRLESPSPSRPSNKSNGTFSHPMLLNHARFAILHSFMPHRPSGAAFKSGSTQGR